MRDQVPIGSNVRGRLHVGRMFDGGARFHVGTGRDLSLHETCDPELNSDVFLQSNNSYLNKKQPAHTGRL
jgi:hypothetical protein